MSCPSVREALSARLGGEHEPVPAAEVAAHLGTCAVSAGWLVRAIRVRPVPDLADVTLPAHHMSWRRVD